MTETTLFMFYQQLGGTKTMRQLNRTEKQLLSSLPFISKWVAQVRLAIWAKRSTNSPNQSRMMTEYWVELKTWTGLVLKDLIDQSGALIYINAALITMTEVVKAIAKSRGLGDENFLTGLFENRRCDQWCRWRVARQAPWLWQIPFVEGAETASPLAIDEKLLASNHGLFKQNRPSGKLGNWC